MMMHAFLLADLEDIGKIAAVLIPILIVGARWLIGQAQQNQQKANPPVGRGPGPRQPPRPQVVPAPGGPANPSDEVEEFLRRVAQRRGDQPAQRVEVARPEPPQARPVSPPLRPGLPSAAQPKPPPPKQPKQPQPAGSSVAEHVAHTMDSGKFRDRAEHMTTIDQADEQMQAHVQSVFRHPIGQLATESVTEPETQSSTEATSVAPSAQVTTAEAWAAVLRNPENMRQALVLSELLQRPKFGRKR